jgi:inner membrane protein
MFPIGHIAYTCGVVDVLRRRVPAWADVDFRCVAVASVLPDVIDKPLAVTVFHASQTSQGLGHTLLLHIIVAATALAFMRGRALPYVLAFSGHLVLDQIWHHPATALFPFMGWEFDPYRFMGTPRAMVSVYRDLFVLPQVWMAEAVALLLLGAYIARYHLYRWTELRRLLRTGCVTCATPALPQGVKGNTIGRKTSPSRNALVSGQRRQRP